MEDCELHMWSYWRDEKGIIEALEDYYPELLKNSTMLQAALVQHKSAEVFIDNLMQQLADKEG